MPTFRNDVKLGTKVPLIKTDDLDDRCVTEDKLAEGCVSADKISQDAVTAEKIAAGSIGTEKLAEGCVTKEKIADGAVTVEKLSEEYLPLKGGTIGTGAPTTTLKAGNITLEGVGGNIHKPGVYITKSVEISDTSITGTRSDATEPTFKINDEGITAKQFVTKDQSVQGLLANNGGIAVEMSDAEIDGLFE